MKTYSDKTYYIYALCDPDTKEVKYIGASIRPKVRFQEHMSSYSYWGDHSKAAWIAILKEAGKKPLLVVLDSCLGWDAARIEERRYYDKYNNGTLLNSANHLYGGKDKRLIKPVILDPGRCQGITTKNKQCTRLPTYNQFCCKHRKY